MTFNDQIFEDQTVNLDENQFTGCSFRRCEVIYQGGDNVALRTNHFTECRFMFTGAAGRTLQFLRAMAHDFGHDLVATLFNEILTVPPEEKL